MFVEEKPPKDCPQEVKKNPIYTFVHKSRLYLQNFFEHKRQSMNEFKKTIKLSINFVFLKLFWYLLQFFSLIDISDSAHAEQSPIEGFLVTDWNYETWVAYRLIQLE